MRLFNKITPLLLVVFACSNLISVRSHATVACSDWVKVNEDAFGLGTGPDGAYTSEEGHEVLVFNGQLYLGMEADNTLGARLWRTKAGIVVPNDQSDWEEVVADADGYPFGIADLVQNDHIDSLAEFNGYLYASTANWGSGGQNTAGTLIFRSPTGDPGSWSNAIAPYGPGFGDTDNENFKDMLVYGDWLCGGTWNQGSGAQVWCTMDGVTWTQKNLSGFGIETNDASNKIIWSSFVFKDALYFGVQDTGHDPNEDADDVGKLFRTNNIDGTPSWTEVYSGTPGSNRVNVLGETNDYLYISVENSEGILILRSSSGNPDTWVQANTPGMDGNPQNSSVLVDGSVRYNGALYVSVGNGQTGLELWYTMGLLQANGPLVGWAQVSDSGLGDPNNVYAELIPFNDYLYAWTSNYVTGQQVLRSSCSTVKYSIFLPTVTLSAIPRRSHRRQ